MNEARVKLVSAHGWVEIAMTPGILPLTYARCQCQLTHGFVNVNMLKLASQSDLAAVGMKLGHALALLHALMQTH